MSDMKEQMYTSDDAKDHGEVIPKKRPRMIEIPIEEVKRDNLKNINLKGLIDVGTTKITQSSNITPLAGITSNDIKQELLDTSDMKERMDTSDDAKNPEEVIPKKRPRMIEIPIEEVKGEDLKNINLKGLIDVGTIKIIQPSNIRSLAGITSNDIKQEPLDVDQTDPDDVTTLSIPEGSEQHEMEDIKYANTQDYLDIGETVVSKQDREISEQDRTTPGPSSKGDVRCQTNIPKNKETTFLAGEKQFECDIHDYKCRRHVVTEGSMTTHAGDKPNKCEICGYECGNQSNLNMHVRTHTEEKPYQCEICDYRCRQFDNLKSHMRMHTGEKTYKCEICDNQFGKACTLKTHMRTHTGEKPYNCEVCDYQCRHTGSLKRHMRIHTGEKPFKCEVCEYECGDQGNLKKHMRTHNGDRPYECEICDYQSRELGTLKRHMKTHARAKPYKCVLCDYRCLYSGMLQKHMRTHTRRKPYKS